MQIIRYRLGGGGGGLGGLVKVHDDGVDALWIFSSARFRRTLVEPQEF